MQERAKRIVFFHPDLGIGGAERLVIDAAVGLQDRGHRVTIFTSHCDPAHCFDEARDGTLDVRVRGNTIIPPSLFSRFSIICAILRQIHLILQICLFTFELQSLSPDVFFVDQLSAGIPLLQMYFPLVGTIFYCHFPDKLLATREGLLKRLYRVPFDWLEGWTTGSSDVIVVNSNFTKEVFGKAFPYLKDRRPHVVYPCVIDNDDDGNTTEENRRSTQSLWQGKRFALSINRFERKKDIGLAIRAYARLSPVTRAQSRLVLAGGYDPRMQENVSYHTELQQLATSLGLTHATAKPAETPPELSSDVDVLFLLSISSSLKATLLRHAEMLLYTPKFEHFGIVPLEAMLAETPVLAATTGGPRETIVDGRTGWLRSVDSVDEWYAVIDEVLSSNLDDDDSQERLRTMGRQGRERARTEFSKQKMAERLDDEISEMIRSLRGKAARSGVLSRFLLMGFALLGCAMLWLWLSFT